MGCNCGGSTPRQEKKLDSPKLTKTVPPPVPRRSGGPGQPGYAWNGPKKP